MLLWILLSGPFLDEHAVVRNLQGVSMPQISHGLSFF